MMVEFKDAFIKPVFEMKDSDTNAFCIKDVVYSYKQLFDYVEQIFNVTIEIPDRLIALYAVDDIRTYATIISLWLQGKAYIPLNPSQPIDRHKETIERVHGKYVISSIQDYSLDLDGVEMIYTQEFESVDYVRKGTIKIADVDDEELAYIIFTSGSTGTPKGVQITRGNIARFIDSMNCIGLNITSKDKCLQPFDLTFDFSISSYLIPLINGASVYTIPDKAVKFTYIAELLEKYHLTVLQMVPSMIRNLLPYMDDVKLTSVRYNILCGESLTCDIIKRWHQGNQNMVSYNMYGPTENTVFCTFYRIDKTNIELPKSANNIVCIGKSFKNSSLILVDEENNIITNVNRIGELCLCGGQLTSGYWENEKENTEKFFDVKGFRCYRTGDLCYYSKDRFLMFSNRKDFQIKINGFRVELGEIESLYAEVSEGKFCVVLPYLNEQNNTKLAIIIESEEYNYSKHKEYLISKLPKYEIPSRWLFVKNIPLNQNGKVDRKKLSKMFMIK